MDATGFLKSLDADELRDHIEALDRERDALMVLLRAAKRRGALPRKTHEDEAQPEVQQS